MPITPSPPYPKSSGDSIRSADWNQAVNEVIRLDTAKLNRNTNERLRGNLVVARDDLSGSLSVGVVTAHSKLHVAGGVSNLNGTEGDFKIGNATHRLKIGVATSGGSSGDVRIRAAGGTNRLMLGAGTSDSLTILGTGRIGIGTVNPYAQLTVTESIGFANATTPMLFIYQSGSTNPDRPILSHSPSSSNWGLAYRDVGDKMIFQRAGSPVMTVDLNLRRVGIGTDSPNRALTVESTSNTYLNVRRTSGAEILMGGESSVGIVSVMTNHNLQLRANNSTKMTITPAGRVGIGTTSPDSKLHVAHSVSGTGTNPAHNVAFFQNTSTGTNADVMLLRVNRATPHAQQNFITFMGSGSTSLGAVQGNGSGSVQYAGTGQDYAEWLPRLNPEEALEAGDVVGVFAGKITKNTEEADHVMVLSSGPIVVGNMPQRTQEHAYETVAFVGQAPVKVRGSVKKGDYIVTSGLHDGVAVAVAPETMTRDTLARIVGKAWEASDEEGIKPINTAVGLQTNPALVVDVLLDILNAQQTALAELHTRLDTLVPA